MDHPRIIASDTQLRIGHHPASDGTRTEAREEVAKEAARRQRS
jgi:hypothetical protein